MSNLRSNRAVRGYLTPDFLVVPNTLERRITAPNNEHEEMP
jgi:hypothetical protein